LYESNISDIGSFVKGAMFQSVYCNKNGTHLACLLSLTLDKRGGRRGGSALPLIHRTLWTILTLIQTHFLDFCIQSSRSYDTILFIAISR